MSNGTHILDDNRLYIQYSEDPGWDYKGGTNLPNGTESVWSWEESYIPVPHIYNDVTVGPHKFQRVKVGAKGVWSLPQRIAGNSIARVDFIYESEDSSFINYKVITTYEDGFSYESELPIQVPKGESGKDSDGANNPAPSTWFNNEAALKAYTGYVDGERYGVFDSQFVYIYRASSSVGIKPDDNSSGLGRYVFEYSFAGQFAETSDIDVTPMVQAAKAMTPYLLQYWYDTQGLKVHVENTNIHYVDAPADNKIYVRQDNVWIELPESAYSLGELTDVTLTNPTDTQGLHYDVGSGMWVNKKAVQFTQSADKTPAQELDVTNDGRVSLILAGSEPIGVLDSAGITPGDVVRFVFEDAGSTILHDFDKTTITPTPPNLADLVPIWLQTKSTYTTGDQLEAFDLALIEKSNGERYWVEVSNSSVAGSVIPETFIADKGTQTGFTATAGVSTLTGLADGEASSALVYGSASFTPNAENNALTCTATGVVTGLLVAGITVSFGTGLKVGTTAIGISYPTGRRIYLDGAGAVGSDSSAPYVEHELGFINCGSGVIVPGNDLILV